MKTSRYTEAQIIAILRQAEGGVPVAELCREHGMMPLPCNGLPSNQERECVVLQWLYDVDSRLCAADLATERYSFWSWMWGMACNVVSDLDRNASARVDG